MTIITAANANCSSCARHRWSTLYIQNCHYLPNNTLKYIRTLLPFYRQEETKTKIQVLKPRFKPRPSGSTVCALPHYFMLQAYVSIIDKQDIPSQPPHLEDSITPVSVTLITHLWCKRSGSGSESHLTNFPAFQIPRGAPLVLYCNVLLIGSVLLFLLNFQYVFLLFLSRKHPLFSTFLCRGNSSFHSCREQHWFILRTSTNLEGPKQPARGSLQPQLRGE